MKTRREQFKELFPNEPSFRFDQIEKAMFDGRVKGWEGITTLPKNIRETIGDKIPWMSSRPVKVFESVHGDTYKVLLAEEDGLLFESVLMQNRRGQSPSAQVRTQEPRNQRRLSENRAHIKQGQWTICVSSQIGCAMGCVFCATGTMGLKRSLTDEEIADQYRFWKSFLAERRHLPQRISNVVFMGMGEPMANYDNVKSAIIKWLKYTDLGPTRITVSSVGILPQLEKLLHDKDWPHVRIAISLHSANPDRRKEIVPTTIPGFHEKLADWSQKYAEILGNRRHYITYEYTLINGVNDTREHAIELAEYILKTSASKVNIIPLNPVAGKKFTRSHKENIQKFKDLLLSRGVDVTQRRTMGDDIAAACGQLVVNQVNLK